MEQTEYAHRQTDRQTDRQQERSHYRRQLPKYFVWVELFSQVFIQSETLGENVKLLHGVFQVSV